MFHLYNSLQIALCVVFRVGCLLVLEWGEYVYDDGWMDKTQNVCSGFTKYF